VRWRGSFATAIHDQRDNAFEVGSHIFGGDSQCLNSARSNPGIPSKIGFGNLLRIMRQTINFHRDGSRLAVKIQDKWSEGVLPSKLQSRGP